MSTTISNNNNSNKWIKWASIIITIAVLTFTIISTASVLQKQVDINTKDIENHEVQLKDHESRIIKEETTSEARKEQLDRIENKLDRALGIEN